MSDDPREYAGYVSHRVNRITGAMIVVLDTSVDDPAVDPDGGRWATLCDTHGNVVNHQKRSYADAWASSPEEWCSGCRALAELGRKVKGARRPRVRVSFSFRQALLLHTAMSAAREAWESELQVTEMKDFDAALQSLKRAIKKARSSP